MLCVVPSLWYANGLIVEITISVKYKELGEHQGSEAQGPGSLGIAPHIHIAEVQGQCFVSPEKPVAICLLL